MRKLLLTSAGFDNQKIAEKTKELLNHNMKDIKVLFVTSAAVTEAQKGILPMCKKEILELGVYGENIDTYDFEYPLKDEIIKYDLIYVAGGSTQHLLEKLEPWKQAIEMFLDHGGLYVGVSAGSIAMTYPRGLGYLDCKMKVHQKVGDKQFNAGEQLSLTDDQAVLMIDDEITIIS